LFPFAPQGHQKPWLLLFYNLWSLKLIFFVKKKTNKRNATIVLTMVSDAPAGQRETIVSLCPAGASETMVF